MTFVTLTGSSLLFALTFIGCISLSCERSLVIVHYPLHFQYFCTVFTKDCAGWVWPGTVHACGVHALPLVLVTASYDNHLLMMRCMSDLERKKTGKELV